jgi:hypothetical protein
MQNCRGRNSRGEFTRFIRCCYTGLVGERWKGLSEPEDLPGVDDLLGSFCWYDALCINQQDLTERNEQVLRMRELYKHADRVIVWLGSSSRSGSLALSTLEHVGKQFEFTAGNMLFPAPNATEPEWHRPEHSLPYDEDTWHSIYELLIRPWFDRVWVVQEIQLASPKAIIQCGTEQVPWCFFRRGVICLLNKLHCVPTYLMDRLSIVGRVCPKISGWTLPQLLMFSVINDLI